jgi:signal transduction histidine kinase/ActR/RegA family two-component response regulator
MSQHLDHGDYARFHELAARVAEGRPQARIVLVDTSGRQLVNTARPAGTPLPSVFEPATPSGPDAATGPTASSHNREGWREVLRTGNAQFSNYFLGALETSPSVSFRMPVVRDGAVRYALAIAYPPDGFGTLLGLDRPTETWHAFLMDRRGVIVASSEEPGRYTGQPAPTALLDRTAGDQGGTREITLPEIGRVMVATETLPRSGWTVALTVTRESVAGGLYRSLAVWSSVILALVALGVFLARRTWTMVGEPLALIAANARAFEHGEPIRVPQSRVREVRDCGRAWSLAIDADQARRAQERLRAAAEARQQEMEQSSREKDRVLAALGHELRNPLGAITSSVHVLESSPPANDRSRQMIAIIRRQAQHLGRLVDDLLDLARATFGKMALQRRPLDLLALVRQTVGSYAPRRTEIPTLWAGGTTVWVDGDATRLDQVLRNLLDNAIKFTPVDGEITVLVSSDETDAFLDVRDTGKGFAPEMAEGLFEAFVQSDQSLDRAQGGLGLGLALVRQIIELHGGQVHAESPGPTLGTQVRVRLPKRAAPRPLRLRADASATAAQCRVLVVEDQPDARASLETLLALMGHDARGAPDAAAALRVLDEWRPDALLIDLGLPDMDGFALARRLRASAGFARLWLIALTGYAQPEDRARARAAGFDDFLVKPADRDALTEALGKHAWPASDAP